MPRWCWMALLALAFYGGGARPQGEACRLAMRDGVRLATDVYLPEGEPLRAHTHVQTATNTLYCDAQRASYLLLPVTNAR
ncbi:MAG: hypothetical protein ACK4NB_05695 [Fimbriimonadales bacterium]